MNESELANLAEKKLSMAFMVRREMKKLPSLLGEGEKVVNLARGEYDGKEGLVAITDRRIIFLEEGVLRHRLEDFPYDKVTSVQTETGIRSGKLTIFASGNKAVISDVHPKQRSPEIGEFVRTCISAGAPKPSDGPPGAAAETVTDQLKKLGELRDAGVLTLQEFEAKKAELLARI